jgi:flagellar biosynthesis protein FlhF
MQVKTFRGPDARTVLNRIREELGPDAVILSTQNTSHNGQPQCEIMAALEQAGRGNGKSSSNSAFPGWQELHQEWRLLKEHLFSVLKTQADYTLLTPRQRQAMEYLEREGIVPQVSMHLWQALKGNPGASILEALRGVVRTKPWDERHWSGTVHAFAGPHGVGKTSSLLRLALHMRRKQPGLRICLANADQQHGKGRLLLQHYAELGELPFADLRTPEDWRALLLEARHYDKIFIDLAGLPRSENLESWLAQKAFTLPDDACVHLVLSPHYTTDCLEHFAKRFRVPNLASIIWTKLDEAEAFGAVVNLGYTTSLPVSALCFGTSLTSSLALADDQGLWKLVFTHRFPGVRS